LNKNLAQWKKINMTIMPAIPAAKNLAAFSLFLCRRAFALAAAAAAAFTIFENAKGGSKWLHIKRTKGKETRVSQDKWRKIEDVI
jgi:hypothetical protein